MKAWRMTLNAFRNSPIIWTGVLVALMYPVILVNVFMPGYGGILHRVDHMRMAIVNHDPHLGREIISGVRTHAPVEVSVLPTMQAAEKALENRSVQLILQIPTNVTPQIRSYQPATLSFVLDDSNPVMVNDIMDSVGQGITQAVNTQVASQMLRHMSTGPQSHSKANLRRTVAPPVGFLVQPIHASWITIHSTAGFAQEMIPLMFLIGFSVGGMTLATNLEAAALQLPSGIHKWHPFVIRSVIIIGISLMVSGVSTFMISVATGPFTRGFIAIWAFEWLASAAFMYVAQIATLLFGPRGLLANLLVLIISIVSSGAIVPPQLLSAYFLGLRRILPGTYAVNGTFNVLFGGTGTTEDVVRLFAILIVAILLGALIVLVKSTPDVGLWDQEMHHHVSLEQR